MTKLKINFADGTLEVEGEEAFVREIYAEYKERLNSTQSNDSTQEVSTDRHDTPRVSPKKKSKNKKTKGGGRKESFAIVKDLDLSGKGNKQSLKDFYKEKSPSTAMERNAVFVYYLSKTAGVKNISLDHINTCYKDVNVKPPLAFRQSILDTSSRQGWIDTKSMSDIKISARGEAFVEHDLPKQSKKK